MPKTITLNDVHPMLFCISRQEVEGAPDRIIAKCRFKYLDENGDVVTVGTDEPQDWISVEIPADSAVMTQVLQFMTNTVIPFIRERKDLNA